MSEPTLKSKDFIERLEALPELKTFPAVASRLLSACDDENVNARDLVEIIRCDPNLSLQLLRVANSAAYGFGGQIKSLEHAAVVLGFRSVKNLAVSVAAASVFADGDSASRERQILWQHSLAAAVIARRLAELVPSVDPEEAFIAGMVHDVGKLVFFDLAPDDYAYDPNSLESTPTVDEEVETFGIDHGRVGNRCGVEWGLPEEINEAITYHHSPHSSEWAPELVAVVYAANRLAKAWGIGSQAKDVNEEVRANIPDVDLGIDDDQLEAIKESAPEEFAELSDAFSL